MTSIKLGSETAYDKMLVIINVVTLNIDKVHVHVKSHCRRLKHKAKHNNKTFA